MPYLQAPWSDVHAFVAEPTDYQHLSRVGAEDVDTEVQLDCLSNWLLLDILLVFIYNKQK